MTHYGSATDTLPPLPAGGHTVKSNAQPTLTSKSLSLQFASHAHECISYIMMPRTPEQLGIQIQRRTLTILINKGSLALASAQDVEANILCM